MRLSWEYGSYGMVLRTLATRLARVPDRERWQDLRNHDVSWDKRTRAIAELIPSGSRVIEFGAGRCQLARWLPSECMYVPSDIVDRGTGSWVCDLNRRPLPTLRREATLQVAVFSGVIEYLVDLPGVLRWLAPHVDRVVLSYNCAAETNSPASAVRLWASRLASGWVNAYTDAQLRGRCREAGFTALTSRAVDGEPDERIYAFARES